MSYLLIKCYKTRFFLGNINNTDRNGVNKQHTYITYRRTKHSEIKPQKGLVSMKIFDTPFFKTPPPPPILPNSLFMGKIWPLPPEPPLSSKISKTQTPLKIFKQFWATIMVKLENLKILLTVNGHKKPHEQNFWNLIFWSEKTRLYRYCQNKNQFKFTSSSYINLTMKLLIKLYLLAQK